jgi:hypothetical protein
MSTERIHIDATDHPGLSQLARQVRESGKPHVIHLGTEEVAVISPAPRRRAPHVITEADRQAFLEALGGWKDVDTDKFLADIYAARRASDPPRVEL